MSELIGRNFLRALFHAGQRMVHATDGDSSVDDAVAALADATEVLTAGVAEAVITVEDEAFFLGTQMLPHSSLEYNTMLNDMRQRRIDSITLIRDAAVADLADLAALVAGQSDDLPAEGTVRLNERPLQSDELEEQPVSGLRRTYADSLDALRSVSRGERLHLGDVMRVVDGFLDDADFEAQSSLLMATMHNHDELAYYHSVNVCLLSLSLGRFLGLDREQLRHLGLGAILHDIGRVVVDEAALHNMGRLSNEDWAEVRLHPQEGALAIMAATGPGQEVAALVALEHHVRMDGGGYPDLDGRRPHLFSRMVAVADSYDAITSYRPYRSARTPHETLQVLLEGAGTAHDPDILRLFIEMMGVYPPGSLLRLEDGEVVMVTKVDGQERQGVVVRDAAGELLGTPRAVDLAGAAVAAQLLPDEAGVDPASLLEAVEQSEPVER